MKKFKNRNGFTLMEVLIYTSLFAIVGSLLVGILLTITQIQQRESAAAEVTGQLNFITQTINRLVRESSNIEINAGTTVSNLKLRMADATKDPTCVSLVGGVIKLAEGPGGNPNDCTTVTSDLTNDRVVVDTLNFKKFTQYPGHDTVSVDIVVTYSSQNPKSQVQRTLSSAIARVSAATFDSALLPGSDATYDVGYSPTTRWRNGAFSGDLLVSGYIGIGTSPSYQLQLSTDSAAKPGTSSWTVASDERIKTDIRPFTDGLNTILGINPVLYKYNGKGGFIADGKDYIGVIAQDIQKVAPYTVNSYYDKLNPADATSIELLNFNSGDLTFTTINAIKELNNKIEALKAENEALKKRIEILETR